MCISVLNDKGSYTMVRKATITVYLVEESMEKTKKELEREIFQALSKRPVIPWIAEVKKVKVTEE